MKEKTYSSRKILVILVVIVEILRFHRMGNFKNILWYIDLSNTNRFFSSTVTILLPELVYFILWGDFFEENVYRNETILLPRSVSVWKILHEFYFFLFIRVALSIIIICFFISTSHNHLCEEDYINFLLYFFYILNLIFCVNMLSAISSSLIAVFITLSVNIVDMELINTFWIDDMAVQLLLPGGELFLLQKEGIIYQKYLKMLYIILIIVLLMFIHCRVLKEKDWR